VSVDQLARHFTAATVGGTVTSGLPGRFSRRPLWRSGVRCVATTAHALSGDVIRDNHPEISCVGRVRRGRAPVDELSKIQWARALISRVGIADCDQHGRLGGVDLAAALNVVDGEIDAEVCRQRRRDGARDFHRHGNGTAGVPADLRNRTVASLNGRILNAAQRNRRAYGNRERRLVASVVTCGALCCSGQPGAGRSRGRRRCSLRRLRGARRGRRCSGRRARA
jgi:hypothetical protein